MKTMETRGGDTPDSRIIDAAAAAIGEGGIVIIPTDTLYAIGCDATSRKATEALCRIKGLNPQQSWSGGQGNTYVTARVYSFQLTARF